MTARLAKERKSPKAKGWGPWAPFFQLGREERDPATISGGVGQSAEDALKWLAVSLVPLEVVSPPLPLARLGEVEDLIAKLRTAGARGTADRLVNAFGMQLKVEIPRADADTLLAYLQVFLCLYDWLLMRADIDLSRRMTSYVDPFPRDYVLRVVDSDYRPELAGLMDDYLAASPTRNRALDLLPLFLHLDKARVRRVTGDPRIKARPAFHYRLPDCEIDQPGWGLHSAWNDWIEVERIAWRPAAHGIARSSPVPPSPRWNPATTRRATPSRCR